MLVIEESSPPVSVRPGEEFGRGRGRGRDWPNLAGAGIFRLHLFVAGIRPGLKISSYLGRDQAGIGTIKISQPGFGRGFQDLLFLHPKY